MILSTGDCVRVRLIKTRVYGGPDSPVKWGEYSFKAEKGMEFVCVLLGQVKEGEEFDAAAALEKLGWKFVDETSVEDGK